ncbi:MAG: tryptophan synthase subunit alpha [Candidatus Methanomethylophilaceae archaeon]|nr:tryptophan synthase subunit alpha [Candidatus Methanomethylophilaceae archaeon]
MTEIADAFRNGKAFITFVTCGDPDLETTKSVIRSLQDNGADLIELGIPFSDPTAEGPVIQAANTRALSGGVTTDSIFSMLEEMRGEIKVPMVFMTYANVVFSYGTERFVKRCKDVGIKGLILPDVPYEEREDFAPACEKEGMSLISMVAPTSSDRISMISKQAKGFIYLVSSLGVTGTRSEITTDIGAITKIIKQNSDTPVAVGFGISNPEQARKMAVNADGVIVGSAIVRLLEKHGKEAAEPIGEFTRSMKDAIRDL